MIIDDGIYLPKHVTTFKNSYLNSETLYHEENIPGLFLKNSVVKIDRIVLNKIYFTAFAIIKNQFVLFYSIHNYDFDIGLQENIYTGIKIFLELFEKYNKSIQDSLIKEQRITFTKIYLSEHYPTFQIELQNTHKIRMETQINLHIDAENLFGSLHISKDLFKNLLNFKYNIPIDMRVSIYDDHVERLLSKIEFPCLTSWKYELIINRKLSITVNSDINLDNIEDEFEKLNDILSRYPYQILAASSISVLGPFSNTDHFIREFELRYTWLKHNSQFDDEVISILKHISSFNDIVALFPDEPLYFQTNVHEPLLSFGMIKRFSREEINFLLLRFL